METNLLYLGAIAPVLMVVLGALLILLGDVLRLIMPSWLRVDRRIWSIMVCLSALVLSMPLVGMGHFAQLSMPGTGAYFGGGVYADTFALVLNTILLGAVVLLLISSFDQEEGQGMRDRAENEVLLLLALAGAMVMVQAGNLIVLFVGLELLSISVYVLAGTARNEKASMEAALKYFMLGSFSSALLLYGISLVYGSVGSVQYVEISWSLPSESPLVLMLGLALILFGFAFKIAAAPFHFWVADVYQGAPTSITNFMAVIVKVAGFGALLRLLYVAFGEQISGWQELIWWLSILSMCIGNLAALKQRSVKRMLAYSSVAHAGYMLMGTLALGEAQGLQAVLYYLLVYALMTVGSFGIVLICTVGTERQFENDDIQSYARLGMKDPLMALVMTLVLMSLAGIPPLAGFFGKFYLFKAVVNAGFVGIVVVAALNSVVSIFYYFRLIIWMYFKGDHTAVCRESSPSWGPRIAVSFACLLLVALGLFPEDALNFAEAAFQSLNF